MPEGAQTFVDTVSAALNHVGFEAKGHRVHGNEVHVLFEKDGKDGFAAATLRECKMNVGERMLNLCNARFKSGLVTWSNNYHTELKLANV